MHAFEGLQRLTEPFHDWVLLVLMISLIIAIIAYYQKPSIFSILFIAFFNLNTSKKLTDEKSLINNQLYWMLNIVFFINIILVTYIGIQIFNIQPEFDIPLPNIAIIVILTLLIYIIRILTYSIIGWITGHTTVQFKFTKDWMYRNKVFGILLFPGILFMLYLPDKFAQILFITYFSIFILLFIFKIIRGFQFSIINRISLFSFILYLCALEILPVGILIKFLTN